MKSSQSIDLIVSFCILLLLSVATASVVAIPWYTSLPCKMNHGCTCNNYEPHLDLGELQWYGTCTSCDPGFTGWNCLEIVAPCRNGGYRNSSVAYGSTPAPFDATGPLSQLTAGGGGKEGKLQEDEDRSCVCGPAWTGANCQNVQCVNSVGGKGADHVAPPDKMTNFCDKCEEGWDGTACDQCKSDSVCPTGKVCHQGIAAAGHEFNLRCNLTGQLLALMQAQYTTLWAPTQMSCTKPTPFSDPAADANCHVNVFIVDYSETPGHYWAEPWRTTFMYCDLYNCTMLVQSDKTAATYDNPPPAATGARYILTYMLYASCGTLAILGLLAPARWKALYGTKLLFIIFVLAIADVLVGVLFDHKSVTQGSETTMASVYECKETTCKCGETGCSNYVIGRNILPTLTGKSTFSCDQTTGACNLQQSAMKNWPIELANCTAASCIDEKEAPRNRGGHDASNAYSQAGATAADTTGSGLSPSPGTRWELLATAGVVGGLVLIILMHFIYTVCCMVPARRKEFNDLVVTQFHDGYSNLSTQDPLPPPSNAADIGGSVAGEIGHPGGPRPLAAGVSVAGATAGSSSSHRRSTSAGAGSSGTGAGSRGGRGGAAHMVGVGADADTSLMTPTVLRLEGGSFDIPQSGVNSLLNSASVLRAKSNPKTRASMAEVSRSSFTGDNNNNNETRNSGTRMSGGRSSAHAVRTRVLEDINIEMESGHSLAIVGPSGAGKTTMLDLLCHNRKSGTVGGRLSLNGEVIDSGNANTYRSIVGFVPQEDRLIEHLTVRQCIYHAARMRLPLPITDAQVTCLVDEVITELSLIECQHTVVGGRNLRGVSGGERRRVSIAVELVGLPRILILDEMTSGLDSLSARRVMQLVLRLPNSPLRSLARFGRFFCYKPIVIFSIHQPSADIFRMFDKVMVLVGGRAVVSGEARTVLSQALAAACLTEAEAIKSMNIVLGGNSVNASAGGDAGLLSDEAKKKAQKAHQLARTGGGGASASSPTRSDSVGSSNEQQPTDATGGAVAAPAAKNKTSSSAAAAGGGGVDSTPNPAELLLYVAAVFNTQSPSLNLKLTSPTQQQQQQQQHQPHQAQKQHKVANTTDDNDVSDDDEDKEHQYLRNDSSRGAAVVSTAAVQGKGSSAPGGSQSQQQHQQEQPLLVPSALQQVSGVPPERIIEVTQRMQRFYPNFWYQLLFLGRRSRDAFIGNFSLTSCHIGAAVVLAWLFSYLYQDEALDLAGTEDKAGMITFLLLIVAFSSLSCLELLVGERLVFASDYDRGLYGVVPYFMVKCFFDFIPHRIIPTAILAVGTYFPMGLRLDGGVHFAIFFTVLQLFAIWNVSLCICVGIIFADFGASALVSALIILWNTAFGGLMVQGTSIPKLLRPFKYLSPAFFAYESVLINELEDQQCKFNPATSSDGRAGVAVIVHCEEFLLNLGLDPDAFVRDMMALAGGTVGFVIAAIILVKISAEVRKTH